MDEFTSARRIEFSLSSFLLLLEPRAFFFLALVVVPRCSILRSSTHARMEPSDLSLSRTSPRRELQGPRPTPLKVRKHSHKIKKPPTAAATAAPVRPPVIIYTVSPKVIHANRSEFMSLVQRLTGAATASSAAAQADAGAPSAAARLAAFERATPQGRPAAGGDDQVLHQLGIDGGGIATGRGTGFFPAGVLSPAPCELFASSSAVQHQLNLFNELSPALSNSGYVENTFLQISPGYNNNFLSSPILPSPGACWDLLNQNHGF
ncbi:hypothetical protein Cni_G27588 [Canna indica]|uniref:VQ domain-containing protein n=1 Tax=Canna indica TaxID=4628 RepID=A0AAQ3L5V8_9LILI|nr:hypothetical protein Cni_G27588 [Canna indica]